MNKERLYAVYSAAVRKRRMKITTDAELIAWARLYADWADDNICEVPVMLPAALRELADRLEKHNARTIR